MVPRPRFLSFPRFLILFPMISYGLVFVPQGFASGENPQEEKIVLGLPELIHLAITRSPEVGEVQSEIGAAQSDLKQVTGAYYPQLESTALIGPVPDAKEPLVMNGRIIDPSPSLSPSSIGIFGRLDLTLTQPLYTFGKLSNRREAASRGVKA